MRASFVYLIFSKQHAFVRKQSFEIKIRENVNLLEIYLFYLVISVTIIRLI